jgi:hypothetical protein
MPAFAWNTSRTGKTEMKVGIPGRQKLIFGNW